MTALLLVPAGRAQETNLTPRGMDALAANATFSTSFTFNRSMLESASQNMPDDLRPLVAKLRSITVHTFRFSQPGLYNPADLDAVRAQYSGEGWTHWREQKRDAAGASVDAGPDAAMDSPDPVRTDVWVRMKHANVEGVVLLVANERNVNIVVVDGRIDPLELLHLRGHLGIPRDAGQDWEPGSH